MAQIINLRMARKASKRAETQAQAAANRARHGQPRASRLAQAQAEERLARQVEGARLERQDEADA